MEKFFNYCKIELQFKNWMKETHDSFNQQFSKRSQENSLPIFLLLLLDLSFRNGGVAEDHGDPEATQLPSRSEPEVIKREGFAKGILKKCLCDFEKPRKRASQKRKMESTEQSKEGGSRNKLVEESRLPG